MSWAPVCLVTFGQARFEGPSGLCLETGKTVALQPRNSFAVPGISAFRLNACWSTIKSPFGWVGAPPVQMCRRPGRHLLEPIANEAVNRSSCAVELALGCQGSCPF